MLRGAGLTGEHVTSPNGHVILAGIAVYCPTQAEKSDKPLSSGCGLTDFYRSWPNSGKKKGGVAIDAPNSRLKRTSSIDIRNRSIAVLDTALRCIPTDSRHCCRNHCGKLRSCTTRRSSAGSKHMGTETEADSARYFRRKTADHPMM
jgi:hypothetical protein